MSNIDRVDSFIREIETERRIINYHCKRYGKLLSENMYRVNRIYIGEEFIDMLNRHHIPFTRKAGYYIVVIDVEDGIVVKH